MTPDTKYKVGRDRDQILTSPSPVRIWPTQPVLHICDPKSDLSGSLTYVVFALQVEVSGIWTHLPSFLVSQGFIAVQADVLFTGVKSFAV